MDPGLAAPLLHPYLQEWNAYYPLKSSQQPPAPSEVLLSFSPSLMVFTPQECCLPVINFFLLSLLIPSSGFLGATTTRHTPAIPSTAVCDLFMGIPFLVHYLLIVLEQMVSTAPKDVANAQYMFTEL